ncbi:MAG: aminomethyltransferase [Moorella sp. (in: firmicutes)]|uniref:glycine cleavage system aminomethyltransferase GcvT n=1 Tax=Moorella sp. E308F TaxID=2572682 RepID=UPI0010FFC2F8|nr:glycine cleavage system aminomethyltransferase GcvT [Moorella sp. E308F]MDK2815889.1 aminomethyltransferase [Moorella sp. (in: firmicutes)]MDK2895830.1 aminomethyltransferase [Moorella sp. (in: firmicutes)]GEA13892.1 aminomethyltransferase [Moorella sp. E308F]
MAELKKTPLYAEHIAAGARIVEFGGWLMPVQYTGIIEEHQQVRNCAGLFDVSHMGEIVIKGPDAFNLVQKLITNDAARATGNRVVYSPMCYPDGGIVDDLLVYPQGEGEYLLVVNAGNIDKDFAWIRENAAGLAVEVSDISAATAQLALQGPRALGILQPLTDVELAPLGYYRWTRGRVLGVDCLISRTGYTGEDGFEIYFAAADAPAMWRQLLVAGQEAGLVPAGLGARDTLRLEAALPLYGHELGPTISPLEAGLGRFVCLEKGEFNGRAALAAQKEAGIKRRLVGLAMVDRGIPRPEYPVLAGGREIGYVTSGSFAPTLGKNIALALVAAGTVSAGAEVEVSIRSRLHRAVVVDLPFYRRPRK